MSKNGRNFEDKYSFTHINMRDQYQVDLEIWINKWKQVWDCYICAHWKMFENWNGVDANCLFSPSVIIRHLSWQGTVVAFCAVIVALIIHCIYWPLQLSLFLLSTWCLLSDFLSRRQLESIWPIYNSWLWLEKKSLFPALEPLLCSAIFCTVWLTNVSHTTQKMKKTAGFLQWIVCRCI